MAMFPCAVGSHRYSGPQRSAYLGVANGAMSARSKLRLCSPHYRDLSAFLEQTLLLVAIGDVDQSEESVFTQSCAHHPDRYSDWRAFANTYDRGEEPRAYAASLCAECCEGFRRVGQIELS